MGHLKKNNETYLSHFLFASKIGVTLMFRGLVFLLHAVLPFELPNTLNLEDTITKLKKWNRYTDERVKNETSA